MSHLPKYIYHILLYSIIHNLLSILDAMILISSKEQKIQIFSLITAVHDNFTIKFAYKIYGC